MRQSIHYKHTQTGALILAILGLVILFIIGLLIFKGWHWGVGIVLGATVIAIILFSSLTVEVRHGWVRFWFGPGLIRKKYAIEEIVTAEKVRNSWYYGWGIHLTPHGWLYNVSGLDAVEITLKSGKRLRIGTNQPVELTKAIHRAAGLDI